MGIIWKITLRYIAEMALTLALALMKSSSQKWRLNLIIKDSGFHPFASPGSQYNLIKLLKDKTSVTLIF